MKCKHCGEEITNDSVFCEFCGTKVINEENKQASGWLKFGSFMIPILGLILYIIKKKEEPLVAKSCLKWGIAGFVLGLLFNIILIASAFNNSSDYYDPYNYENDYEVEEDVLMDEPIEEVAEEYSYPYEEETVLSNARR